MFDIKEFYRSIKECLLKNALNFAEQHTEVCEAVGNLYRDDGLAIFKSVIGSKAEQIKKDIQKLFKNNHLNITIQCNLKIANYLDVTINLSNATYRPFCKPNNDIAYIHKESNHTPSILRQIPLSIECRLSKHSSSE